MTTSTLPPPGSALEAYEALAPHYDGLTHGYDHDRWLLALEELALRHGLRGKRLLDVGCGTGKSFLPLLARGYETTACDLSPGMLAVAGRRAGGRARLLAADMRALPEIGHFDLITCVDDAVNYLLDEQDLAAAMDSMARRLAPDGVLVFDVNTLATYRTVFARPIVRRQGGLEFRWLGEGTPDAGAGTLATATVEVLTEGRDVISISRHRQRHHPERAVRRALSRAGLECLARYGQCTGVRLERPPRELDHTKVVWLARRRRGGKTERAEEVPT